MGVEENKQVVRRYFDEVLGQGKLDLLDSLAASDYRENSPLPGQGAAREGLKSRVAGLRNGFPDICYTIVDVIGEGDMLAVRWAMQGTQAGEILGIPPSGKHVSLTGMDFIRFADGRMAEHWDQVDVLALLQQLGVMPVLQQGG